MFKIEKDKAFYYSLSIIRFAGNYPLFNNNTLIFIHVFLIQALFSVPWLMLMVLHLISNAKDNNYRLSEVLADLSADIGLILCSVLFAIHHKKWSKLFTGLTSFGQFGKPPKYDAVVRKYRYLALIFYAYVTSTLIVYVLVSLSDIPNCEKRKKKLNLDEICGLFTPIWSPKGVELSQNLRILVIVWQIVSSQITLPMMMVIPGVCIEGVELIVTRIDHLQELIEEIFDRPGELKIQIQKMNHWVRYHQHVISLSNELNYAIKITNGYTVGCGALVLACIATQIRKESLPKGYLFALGYCVILFTVCHSGQRLYDETGKLSLVVFGTKWYNSPVIIQKYLPFIIARAQKPNGIDALPVGKLGYSLFLLMIRTSYRYVTFMDASMNHL